MTVANSSCFSCLSQSQVHRRLVPRKITLMLGEKSGGIKPGSKPSPDPGQDKEKWDMDRNRSMCGATKKSISWSRCVYQTAPTSHLRRAFKWIHPRIINKGVGRCRALPTLLYSNAMNTKFLAQLEIWSNILNDEELLSVSFVPVCVTDRL